MINLLLREEMGADIVNREQIGRLESGTPDEDELPSHLQSPLEDEEDCYGPVPPRIAPYDAVHLDPYVNDYNARGSKR